MSLAFRHMAETSKLICKKYLQKVAPVGHENIIRIPTLRYKDNQIIMTERWIMIRRYSSIDKKDDQIQSVDQ